MPNVVKLLSGERTVAVTLVMMMAFFITPARNSKIKLNVRLLDNFTNQITKVI